MAREVTNVIPSSEVMGKMMGGAHPVIVKEKRDGTWVVLYADPGFIPCAPACSFGQRGQPLPSHKHEYSPKYIETEYKPTSFDDAKHWANLINDTSLPVQVVPFTSKGGQHEVLVEETVANDDDE